MRANLILHRTRSENYFDLNNDFTKNYYLLYNNINDTKISQTLYDPFKLLFKCPISSYSLTKRK